MLALQLVSIALVVADVLIARSLLSGLLHADSEGNDVAGLLPEVLGLSGLTAALGVANAVQLHCQRMLAELCTRLGEDRVMAVTASVPLSAFDAPGFHDAVERAVLAVRRLPAVVISLSGLLRALAGAVGAVGALAVLEPLFAPAVLLVLIPTSIVARRRGRVFYRYAYAITPSERVRRYLTEILADRDAAKEIRAYGLSGFFDARRDRLWDERLGGLRAVSRRHLGFTILGDLVAAGLIATTLVVLIALTLSHDISLANAGATAVAVVLLGQRLMFAASSTGSLSESALFIEDYLALIAGAPERSSPGEAPAPPAEATRRRPPHVSAQHVTFSYAGTRAPALRDVSLEIGPGEVVALVGENGSGKTTMAKVLAGLYEPESGLVMWNGQPSAADGAGVLRHDVAIIFQDFMRYALPARENIGLGRHERLPDDEGVSRAAQAAGAHHDLDRLPHGYDTILGPSFVGGTDLSSGQWQRVALARALFRDAPFVILDEPTAALDAQAEHDLFAGIRQLLLGRSVLLISHRFSSVREADRIHVMHAGQIIESGTHDQLMARGRKYAELFELQAAPYR